MCGNYNFCCIPCDKKRKAVYRLENKEKIALAEFKYMNTERGYVLEVIGGIFQRYKKKDNRKGHYDYFYFFPSINVCLFF